MFKIKNYLNIKLIFCMETNNLRSKDCIAKPIFIGEVNLYLKERFKILDIENGQKVDNDSVHKVINYSFFKSLIFLKKEMIKIILFKLLLMMMKEFKVINFME